MKKTNALITIATLLISIITINYISSKHSLRLDLTQDNLYTLSSSTKTILSDIDDVVTVRAYFTKDLPSQALPLRTYVDDLLDEFKRYAGDKLQVEFIDPNTSQADEKAAMMLGIPPVQLNVAGADKLEVAKIFLGMAILYNGKQEVIPVVRRSENLEYELAKSIIKVSRDSAPQVGLWQGAVDPASIGGHEFKGIHKMINDRYEIKMISEESMSMMSSLSTLILISPREMSEAMQKALDQYIANGGHVMVFADRFDLYPNLTVKPVHSPVFDLLVSYGITVEPELVLDQVNAKAAFSQGYLTYHTPYAYWPRIMQNQFNANQSIVADLETAVFPWTSSLIIKDMPNEDALKNGTMANTILAMSSMHASGQIESSINLDFKIANNTAKSASGTPKVLMGMIKGPF